MNIFATNIDPIVAAKELCDQHVRAKMPVEGCIMLQHCFDNKTLLNAPKTKTGKVRKSGGGYFNHPCSVWVRESKENFMWLVDNSIEMCNERMFRWPSSQEHFCREFLVWAKHNANLINCFKKKELTKFAIAINSECICRQTANFDKLDEISKYQLYIKHDKPFATWTKRSKPYWY